MSRDYEKPPTPSSGLRLHLNENTAGCSPAVIEALRSISAQDAALYPDYSRAIAACAAYLGIDEDQFLLTNGLDEGILATSVTVLSGGSDSQHEVIAIVPAFEMYAVCAAAAGGCVREIPQGPDFVFPLASVLGAINRRTRLIFLTNPNNPTGLSIARDSILAVADAAPNATILLDEAYSDFSDTSLLGDPALAGRPNILIGRTFSKAFGLAGLRVGALIGDPRLLTGIRRVVPPYSLNLAATIALPAALQDRDYVDWYIRESAASKRLLYDAMERLRVKYWKSDANFILANFGAQAPLVVGGLTARGIHLRDRSMDYGCRGCLRITAGVVEHTRRFIQSIEEVLCAVR